MTLSFAALYCAVNIDTIAIDCAPSTVSADRTASLHERAKNGKPLTATEVDWIFSRLANAEARAHRAEAALQAQQPLNRAMNRPGSAHSGGYMQTVIQPLQQQQQSRSQSVKSLRPSPSAHSRLGLPGTTSWDSNRLQRSASSAGALIRGQSAPAQRRGAYPAAATKLADLISPHPHASPVAKAALLATNISGKPTPSFPRMPLCPVPIGTQNPGSTGRTSSNGSTGSNQGRPLQGQHLTGAGAGLWSTGLVAEAHRVYTLADRNRNGVLDFHVCTRAHHIP